MTGRARRHPSGSASTTARTSSRVIRPPPPVPTICSGLRACSRSRRRTAGVMRASGSPCAPGAWVAVGGGAVAARRRERVPSPRDSVGSGGACRLDGDRVVRTLASVHRLSRLRVGGLGSCRGCGSRRGRAVAVGRGRAPSSDAPSSAVSITAISALFGTVAPSSARISFRTPSNGDGTSALTLSVMTSSSGSYLSTWSPGCLSHLPIVPSATLSPSWGIVTFATFAAPSRGRRLATVLVSPIRAIAVECRCGGSAGATARLAGIRPSR